MKRPRAIKILLIEDTPADVEVMRDAMSLEKGQDFEITNVSTLADGLGYLSRTTADLVLLDLKLPDANGLEGVERVRRQVPQVPIVVLTASDNDALALQALQRGAQDYLVKGYVQVYGNLLGRAVRYAIERARHDEELRGAHAQTEQLLSSLPSILIRLNTDGKITHWNDVAGRKFGLPARAVVGHAMSDIGIKWDMKAVQAAVNACRLDRMPVSMDDLAYTAPDGTTGYIGLTVIPMQPDVPESEILLFGADVTERKQSETERSRLQQQLLQAQKMETIGRFAGGIAHDFNNFLQVILGFSWLIRARHQKDPELMSDLQEIVHAAESASGMVHQLLAFSRKQPLQAKVFDINPTIRSMARLLQQFVGEAIQVNLDLVPRALVVKMDPTGLEQILMNLCANARDSMAQGGTLTISSSQRDVTMAFLGNHIGAKPGDYAVLSIRDTGTGMDPVVAANIFEPFFTTKQQGKGTGLGLAVVYGLVQQHGGFIDIETAPGRGTTFHLYFPRQEASVEEGGGRQPGAVSDSFLEGAGEAAVHAAPRDGRPRRRVLVVDDDAAICVLCQRILKNSYDVTTVPSGRAALQALGDSRYDLLVTDLRMPNMDGVTLLGEALKLADAPKLIAMTGSLTAELEQRLSVIPLNQPVIHKPFTARTLLETVGRCLENGS